MVRFVVGVLLLLGWVGPASAQSATPAPPPPPQPVPNQATVKAAPAVPESWIGIGIASGRGAPWVQVTAIYPDTPAAEAGLVAGDRILAVGKSRVSHASQLVDKISPRAAGERVQLLVDRQGDRHRIPVTLAQKPTHSELAHRQLAGKPAPRVELQRATGRGTVDLSAFRGKVVIAVLFQQKSCQGCDDVLSALETIRRDRGHRELAFVGISPETPGAVRVAARRTGVAFPLLAGLSRDGQDAYAWHMRTRPLVIVIDRRGIVRHAGTIDDPAAPRAVEVLVDRATLVAGRSLSE